MAPNCWVRGSKLAGRSPNPSHKAEVEGTWMEFYFKCHKCTERIVLQTPSFVPRLISSYWRAEGKSLETLGGLYHWIPVSEICRLQSDWRTELLGSVTIKWCGKKATCTVDSVRRLRLASPPGLVAPVFVACSANMGEGLVKLSHVQWCIWTCGGVAHSFSTAIK